ncbi:MAG: DUF4351 domain-containing protein [Actinobacteria bacterium]|nr:DUF4351 domain-containing protein [Actinomycetota bacterium]
MAEAYKKGFALGLSQGLSQGANRILLVMIRRRFGTLLEWMQDKLSQSSISQKELWADRILDASSLEVLFAETGE